MINRLLFWFSDGEEVLTSIKRKFYPLAVYKNKLLNESYKGVKFRFVNLYFYSDKVYELHQKLTRDIAYHHNGDLTYYGTFDYTQLDNVDYLYQKKIIWNTSASYLSNAALQLNNHDLETANKYSFVVGEKNNFNCDHRLKSKEVLIRGQKFLVSIWVRFDEFKMKTFFSIEKNGLILYEKYLDESANGIEFFLHIYRDIVFENDVFVIKGSREIDYLPLKIKLPSHI